MHNYLIDDFWRLRLPSNNATGSNVLAGWERDVAALPTFVEAPLARSTAFGEGADPAVSPIILVSAAGAVGKSTLARQIASMTGAIYLDLAKADPVGGNTLSGGLVKTGILQAWEADAAAVLIDGLDEARLKVTQEGFEAFMNDVAYLCRERKTPTVLFGRTGAIQDAWLVLSDQVPVSVLEIGYYTPELALTFALAHLNRMKPDYPFADTGDRAIALLLEGLRRDTQNDGDRFAGYAPVLQAVADRVAEDSNPNALIAQVERGEQPVTLQAITTAILEREQAKLNSIAFEDASLRNTLYLPDEQMSRLVARVYRQAPPTLPRMSPKDAQAYSNALATWVPDHAFLNGALAPASAVFDAVIVGNALRNNAIGAAAASRELAKGAAANPFLAEFYFSDDMSYIPPEHIGIIYASLRARLSLGDSAGLSVEGVEAEDELEQLRAEVEMSVSRSGGGTTRVLTFETEQAGVIRLGSHIEDVEIVAHSAHVEIGGARETSLVAPVAIQCRHLSITTERVIVECPTRGETGAVDLEARTAETSMVTGVPVTNGSVAFTVTWAGADAYPWTSFQSTPTIVPDPRTDEGLRRFRKFVISFRSHSKGALKRFAGKIEHERMTKGTGQAVLDHMLATEIVSTDGSMYTLHADALAKVTDASYVSIMARQYPDATIAFVGDAITAHN